VYVINYNVYGYTYNIAINLLFLGFENDGCHGTADDCNIFPMQNYKRILKRQEQTTVYEK